MFKDLISKAKDKIDLDSVLKARTNARDFTQGKIKEFGLDKVVDKVKKEGGTVVDAVSASAKDVYSENKDLLEKPVNTVSNVVDKVTEHSSELKWAGGLIAAVVAPIPTAVVSAAIFLLVEDKDTEETLSEMVDNGDLTKKEKKVLTNSDVFTSETDLVRIVINKKEKTIDGVILVGKQKDRTFEEIGLAEIIELQSLLVEEKDENTILLMNHWINWKNTG